MATPPLTFGAVWTPVGVHRRYGHELSLWICPDAPQAWHDAYRHARGVMTAAGYSWTDRANATGTMQPCWWDTGIAFDEPALRAEVDRVVAEAAAVREKRARAEEERHQRDLADTAPLAVPVHAELIRLLAERPWALQRSLTEARDLAAEEAWTSYGLRSAQRFLSNAEANAARAEEHLGRTPPAVWFARAADPAVQAAALAACRFLSELDTDWAAVQNGAGWSQATCWTGHLLSERESLDQGETTHALALLHGHRRQLSDEANLTLFGEIPTRRRRRETDDQPALAL
jgi:hypothetical protein